MLIKYFSCLYSKGYIHKTQKQAKFYKDGLNKLKKEFDIVNLIKNLRRFTLIQEIYLSKY